MATPAPRPPVGDPDEALDILRRIEPVLSRIESEQKEQRRDIGKVQQDLARLDGRVSQLPTLWQIAALVFAIFGAAFVLVRVASGH